MYFCSTTSLQQINRPPGSSAENGCLFKLLYPLGYAARTRAAPGWLQFMVEPEVLAAPAVECWQVFQPGLLEVGRRQIAGRNTPPYLPESLVFHNEISKRPWTCRPPWPKAGTLVGGQGHRSVGCGRNHANHGPNGDRHFWCVVGGNGDFAVGRL